MLNEGERRGGEISFWLDGEMGAHWWLCAAFKPPCATFCTLLCYSHPSLCRRCRPVPPHFEPTSFARVGRSRDAGAAGDGGEGPRESPYVGTGASVQSGGVKEEKAA
jgi:hypothetical protein